LVVELTGKLVRLSYILLMSLTNLPTKMKAAVIHRFGGPKVLQVEEIPLPTPGPGQFLIRVDSASVNPVDYKIRTGKYKMFRPKLPAILGRDIAGTVCAVGAGTRGPFKVGDPVFGMLDYQRGAYARYRVATARELARRPLKLSVNDAGALGVAALTAWQGLFDHGHLKQGERVLIHGAAGGVGHLAVQFSKWRGAYVIATAGKNDLDWVKNLGADRVIDYKNELFENEVGNVDLVYDLIGGETLERSWQVLKEKGGRIISTLNDPTAPQMARSHHASWAHMVVTVKNKQLAQIARLIAEKKVRVEIAKSFPLEKIQAAHELVENGHIRGKIILTLR
jgi:NADPH:quinone reductase-like Zn-dependent oxidoreductase